MKAATILKPEIKKIIDAALQHILSAGKPDKVFLFGSYARGEENEDSQDTIGKYPKHTEGAPLGEMLQSVKDRRLHFNY